MMKVKYKLGWIICTFAFGVLTIIIYNMPTQPTTVGEIAEELHHASDLLPLYDSSDFTNFKAKNGGAGKEAQALSKRLNLSVSSSRCDIVSTNSSTIKIDIFFGYKDARPARFVGDRLEALVLLSAMRRSCAHTESLACGFSQNIEDPFELFKKIDNKVWRVKIHRSSLSLDDQFNRDSDEQIKISHQVEKNFAEALAHSDVVFYNGHSRDGGGPDFFPPLLDSTGHVQYNHYRLKRPGVELLNTNKPQVASQLLGLFSCASTGHFLSSLKRVHPARHHITSSALLYHADAIKNLYMSLELLMKGACLKEWQWGLRSDNYPVGSTLTLRK